MKLDNGREYEQHIPLPKPIAKKMKETKFSQRERELIDVIIEQTLGYESHRDDEGHSVRRTSKPMSYRYLSALTNIPKTSVERYTEALVNRSILTQKLTWFKGQLTNEFGINYNLWMWDKKGNFISEKEYKKLRERAKAVVKSWLESGLDSGYEVVRGKRREKVDLKVIYCGHSEYNVVVIPKTSWGEEFEVDKLKIPNNMPNAVFFFLNRELTQMRCVTPSGYKDLTPRTEQPKPVINSGYIEVPNNSNSRGKPRIQRIDLIKQTLTESPPIPPVPNLVRNDDSLKVPLKVI